MIRPDDISIVAGGWSFAQVKEHGRLPGEIIAVNDSIFHLKCCVKTVVSMDRLWVENRWDDVILLNDLMIWVKDSAVKNIKNHKHFSWVHVFKNHDKICTVSPEPDVLNGTSSGACAINLALKKSPRRLWLWGFDMGRSNTGRTYWYPDYPWAPGGKTKEGKYDAWARQFVYFAEVAKKMGVEIYQVGPKPTIPGIKHLTFKEALI